MNLMIEVASVHAIILLPCFNLNRIGIVASDRE